MIKDTTEPERLPERKGILKLFQPYAASHAETSHLTCTANQMTGFCMK